MALTGAVDMVMSLAVPAMVYPATTLTKGNTNTTVVTQTDNR
jgi:hypothetical protein